MKFGKLYCIISDNSLYIEMIDIYANFKMNDNDKCY